LSPVGHAGVGLQIRSARASRSSRQARRPIEAGAGAPAGMGISMIGSPPTMPGRMTSSGLRMRQSTNWARSTFWSTTRARPGAIQEDHQSRLGYKCDSQHRSMFLLSSDRRNCEDSETKYGRIINLASICRPSWRQRRYATMIALSHQQGLSGEFHSPLAGDWGTHGITSRACTGLLSRRKWTKAKLEAVARTSLRRVLRCVVSATRTISKVPRRLFASAAGKHITGQILHAVA